MLDVINSIHFQTLCGVWLALVFGFQSSHNVFILLGRAYWRNVVSPMATFVSIFSTFESNTLMIFHSDFLPFDSESRD